MGMSALPAGGRAAHGRAGGAPAALSTWQRKGTVRQAYQKAANIRQAQKQSGTHLDIYRAGRGRPQAAASAQQRAQHVRLAAAPAGRGGGGSGLLLGGVLFYQVQGVAIHDASAGQGLAILQDAAPARQAGEAAGGCARRLLQRAAGRGGSAADSAVRGPPVGRALQRSAGHARRPCGRPCLEGAVGS